MRECTGFPYRTISRSVKTRLNVQPSQARLLRRRGVPMSSTKDRILGAAMRLFLEKGYQSTSVADILRTSEAHAGSLYHAFPTKQDVLIAVLEAYRGGIYQMLIEPAWR